jgi:hypothetical protein
VGDPGQCVLISDLEKCGCLGECTPYHVGMNRRDLASVGCRQCRVSHSEECGWTKRPSRVTFFHSNLSKFRLSSCRVTMVKTATPRSTTESSGNRYHPIQITEPEGQYYCSCTQCILKNYPFGAKSISRSTFWRHTILEKKKLEEEEKKKEEEARRQKQMEQSNTGVVTTSNAR